MKLSAEVGHPNYHPQASQVKVFLEGSERKNVVFADEEGRHAILHKLNEHGYPIIDQKTGDYVFEHFWGHVRIETQPGFIDPSKLTTAEEAFKLSVSTAVKAFTASAGGGVVSGGFISQEPAFSQKAADSSADTYIDGGGYSVPRGLIEDEQGIIWFVPGDED